MAHRAGLSRRTARPRRRGKRRRLPDERHRIEHRGRRFIRFFEKPIEDLDAGKSSFDFVTIGRALHWLPREPTLAVFEELVALDGHIAVCGSAAASDSAANAWTEQFRKLRRAWAPDHNESFYRPDLDEWFAPSRFRRVDEVSVDFCHRVSIADLVKRALSFSVTSPSVLGDQRELFETALASALAPFATEGNVEEELVVKATLFARAQG